MFNKINTKIIFDKIKENKFSLLLFFMILFGAYLRLNDFGDLTRFNADQVRDAKVVEAMASGENYPLLGPKAGGTTFKLGGAFYYMQYLSGLVFGFTPQGIAYFIPLLSIASIFLFHLFFKKLFSPSIALSLTFLYATSFYLIKYSRFAWNPNAIPFFIFAFLLLALKIIEDQNKFIHHLLFAVVIGIGMQLHTTLLILFPFLAAATYAYSYLKNKKLQTKGLLAAIFLALMLNTPFFVYDFQNDGKNLKAFFQGANTKTENNTSFFTNIKNTFNFATQGTAYVLTGYEPQKNWMRPLKLAKSGDIKEISSALFGLSVLVFGIILLSLKFKKDKGFPAREKYLLISCFLLSSFTLFTLIGEELNIRFFISIIFLPFLLLGLIMQFLLELKNKKLFPYFSVLLLLVIALASLNLAKYSRVYDLENYQESDSAYGGISLGESSRISSFISDVATRSEKMPDENYLLRTQFNESIQYVSSLKKIKLEKFSETKVSEKTIVFLVSETKDENIPSEFESGYSIIAKEKIGRFSISALKKSEEISANACKIGFITDIHASYSKSSADIIRKESSLPLKNFMKAMADFDPDFIVQGGDIIDGREKSPEIAMQVFDAVINYFSKTNIPSLHVMGNHETRSRGITKNYWLQKTNNENSYYSKDCKNTKIIVLDGMDASDDQNYAFSEKQLAWLKKTLSENGSKKIVAFLHEPLIPRSQISSRLKPEKEFSEKQAEQIKNILKKHGAATIISGHAESLYRKNENNLVHQTLPGIFKSKDEAVSWYHSFYEIVSDSTVSIKMHYKKNPENEKYAVLEIPSQEFDRIEK